MKRSYSFFEPAPSINSLLLDTEYSIDSEYKYHSITNMHSIKVLENELELCKQIIEYKKKYGFNSTLWETKLFNIIIALEEKQKMNPEVYFSQLYIEKNINLNLLQKLKKSSNNSINDQDRILKRISIINQELLSQKRVPANSSSFVDINSLVPSSQNRSINIKVTHIGSITNHKGDKYIGEFNGNKKEGYGILYYKKGGKEEANGKTIIFMVS